MKKKYVILIIFILLFSITGILLYKTVNKIEAKKKISEKLQNLPELTLLTTDSTHFHNSKINPNQPSVLIYFNSECQFCQYEAKEIKNNILDFKDVNLLMISTEPLSKISAFAKDHDLINIPQIQFLQINEEDVYETFGGISVPSIFIYGPDQKLIKQYRGETKMEAVLQYIKD